MVAWNIAFGVLLVAGLRRDAGLRAWTALLPALFFLAAPASVATRLIDAQGGIIEPFVYFALLWFLRRRPIWFGIVLAVGFRNREFTLYAVPVLVGLEWLVGELKRDRWREWLISAAVFLAGWECIEALKPFADLSGPGTHGQLLRGFAGSQVANLADRFDFQPSALWERLARLGPQLVAWLSGATQVDTGLPLHDHVWLVPMAGAALAVAAIRLLMLLVMSDAASSGGSSGGSQRDAIRGRVKRSEFALYLFGVGLLSTAAFVAGRPTLNGYARYVIYGLLIPVGLSASILTLEPRRVVRVIVSLAIVAWASLAIADHARVLTAYARRPPGNPARDVADRLIARRVPVAIARYRRAYVVTFLAQERVRVASNDFPRIQEYESLFVDRMSEGLWISEAPCPDGEPIAWGYLCKPDTQ
jgi:hypothetical protein